jgi:hypothetical protein
MGDERRGVVSSWVSIVTYSLPKEVDVRHQSFFITPLFYYIGTEISL